MNTQIRQQIRQALDIEWEAFATRHPNLARVMDQDAIVEQVATRLAEDPAYQQAMQQALAAGLVAAQLQQLLRTYIGDWLAKLF